MILTFTPVHFVLYVMIGVLLVDLIHEFFWLFDKYIESKKLNDGLSRVAGKATRVGNKKKVRKSKFGF